MSKELNTSKAQITNYKLRITDHLSDDLQFLIACCQAEPTQKDTDFISSYLSRITNYELLITAASQHGIIPLVYKTLKRLSEEGLLRDTSDVNSKTDNKQSQNDSHPSRHPRARPGDPQPQSDNTHSSPITNAPAGNTLGVHVSRITYHDILSAFKQQYMGIAQKNMLMTAELLRIMKLLEANNIEALAFKGPALAQQAYGDITMRQFGDLDIFVHRKDIVHIAEILSDDRYEARVDKKYFSNNAFLDVNSDCQFFNDKQNILIEIHWTVFRKSFSKKMQKIDLWDRPSKVSINHHEIKAFEVEALLLYLCMHGSKHTWERIEWIVDIDKLVRVSPDINWDKVYQMAEQANGTTMLELGLLLTSHLFSTPLSQKYINSLSTNKKILSLEREVFFLLNANKQTTDSELQKNLRHFRFHLELQDGILSKSLFITKALFPLKSSDVELINLPKSLYFIYYLFRPFRLAAKYFSKLFSFLLKDK
ncbi:nucleotidyltransferase domain-containing protein [Sulfurovum mangrovi]|uniref:nucleotidyltransferase domain-containing protein n=1 Tax=Sulfurovum mangrovi TaxID=2893889 RepID=UPI001E550528|nr:nucleotidyltransferase family protein [Sulfurovum mangrovi]UFH59207.1 nucleotidyltransferase family protein [Sulfurovum mangrovi]